MAICKGGVVAENCCNGCFVFIISKQLSAKMTLTLCRVSSTFHNHVVHSEVLNIVEFPSEPIKLCWSSNLQCRGRAINFWGFCWSAWRHGTMYHLAETGLVATARLRETGKRNLQVHVNSHHLLGLILIRDKFFLCFWSAGRHLQKLLEGISRNYRSRQHSFNTLRFWIWCQYSFNKGAHGPLI